MSGERSRWLDAAAKLIKMTQSGTIRWTASAPTSAVIKFSDDVIEVVFHSEFLDKKLRLYKRKFRIRQPIKKEANRNIIQMLFHANTLERGSEINWETEVKLEFITEEGLTLWTFPKVSMLTDLFSAAQYQIAGVKDFLEEILRMEE